MKKLFLLVVLNCFAVTLLHAQSNRSEISIGYGLGTTSNFLDAFSDVLASTVTGASLTSDNENYSGAFHLTYKYIIQEKLAVGATFAYEHSTADTKLNDVKTGSVERNYYTIAAEADYRYVRKSNFCLYSGIGLGYTAHNEKYTPDSGGDETSDNTGHFNFQIIGIGARFGNKLGGFAEAGFGYKGLVCVGAFARF